MKIQDVLFKNAIIIDLKPQSKNDILKEMGGFLASVYNIENPELLVQRLLEREAEVSTGIGYGIAIPHARLDSIDKMCMAVARCVTGVEFDALDERPVHLIFLLVSPTSNADDHRSILSSLSKIMSYEEMRSKLLNASDPDTFLEALIDGENKYT